MPTGFDQAKKVGDYSSRGSSFQERPKGVTYFSLKDDQNEAIVRFLQQHDDINWVRQWRTETKPGHLYGEKLNCIDQFEDGTPDPGFELGMKSSWSGFIPLIWRNAVQYQKDAQGRRIKDGNGNFVIAGYADTVALWEHPWSIYDLLKSVDDDYRGLMSRDFKIKRIGAKGIQQDHLPHRASSDRWSADAVLAGRSAACCRSGDRHRALRSDPDLRRAFHLLEWRPACPADGAAGDGAVRSGSASGGTYRSCTRPVASAAAARADGSTGSAHTDSGSTSTTRCR